MMIKETKAHMFLCPIRKGNYARCSGIKCMMWVKDIKKNVGGCGLVNRG